MPAFACCCSWIFVSPSNLYSIPSQTAWDRGSSCTAASSTRQRAARSCMASCSTTSCCLPTWSNSLSLPALINCSAPSPTPSSKCTKWWVQGCPVVLLIRSSFSFSPLLPPLCGDLIVLISFNFQIPCRKTIKPCRKTIYLNILVEFQLNVGVMTPKQCLLFFQPVFLNEVLVKLPTDPSSDEPVFHISHIDRVYTLKTDNINERWVAQMWIWGTFLNVAEACVPGEQDRG